MASEADHIALANRNHEALARLMQTPDHFPEWITTIAFYKALQVVEAVFDKQQGRHGQGHDRRLDMLKLPPYVPMFKHYRALWSASCVARYLYDTQHEKPYQSFTDYLAADRVVDRMIERRLRPIEQHAVSLMSDDARNALLRIP